MKQDYLSQLLPTRPAVTADELPGAAQIVEADLAAGAVHEALDMLHLTESQRDRIGPAATPAELELDRLYAEATGKVPTLLDMINRPPGAMRHGYDMERALTVYRQANRSLLRIARGALVLSAGALTEGNDRVEEAALALARDRRLPAERRAVIDNARGALDALRARQQESQEGRLLRQQHREARHDAALARAQKRGADARRAAELAAAPLPEANTHGA